MGLQANPNPSPGIRHWIVKFFLEMFTCPLLDANEERTLSATSCFLAGLFMFLSTNTLQNEAVLCFPSVKGRFLWFCVYFWYFIVKFSVTAGKADRYPFVNKRKITLDFIGRVKMPHELDRHCLRHRLNRWYLIHFDVRKCAH